MRLLFTLMKSIRGLSHFRLNAALHFFHRGLLNNNPSYVKKYQPGSLTSRVFLFTFGLKIFLFDILFSGLQALFKVHFLVCYTRSERWITAGVYCATTD